MTYNLSHYTAQGHDWGLSVMLCDALNMWLEYKEELGYPIKSYRSVEMILVNLNGCCDTDAQKVTLIERAIAGGFSSIRYQKPIEKNGQAISDKRASISKLKRDSAQRLIGGADNF